MSLRGRTCFLPEAIPVLGEDCFTAQEQERRLATTYVGSMGVAVIAPRYGDE